MSWLQSLAKEMFALIATGYRGFVSSGHFSSASFSQGWKHDEGKLRGAKRGEMPKRMKAGPAGQGEGFT